MKIGLNTDSLCELSLDAALDYATQLGLDAVEFGLGGWSSAPHLNIAELLADAGARDRDLPIIVPGPAGKQGNVEVMQNTVAAYSG